MPRYKSNKTFKELLCRKPYNADDRNQRPKWRDISCSCIARIHKLKMSISPKLIKRFTIIPIKTPVRFFIDIDNIILKLIWKDRRTRIVKIILKRRMTWEDLSYSHRDLVSNQNLPTRKVLHLMALLVNSTKYFKKN